MIQLENFSDIVRKTISHKATLDTYRRDVKDNKILISKREEELKSLNAMYASMKTSYEYLDVLVKEESGRFIKKLNEILDYGVKSIFDDCDYSIEIRTSDNNKITIHLVYDDDEGNKLDPDIRNVGGGVRTCVGCLMNIFFIFHYRVEPIIFIDEGLSQLSTSYLPNLFDLLNELADKNDLKIFLVTHDERFLQYATRHYKVDDGKVILLSGTKEGSDSDGSNSNISE